MQRRTVLGAALAGVAGAGTAFAQDLRPSATGTPAGTVPFAPEVFRERRQRVMDAMKTGIAVLYGADEINPGQSEEEASQQIANFAWLTGIVDEPGAILVLAPAERTVREWLLLPSRNQEAERWDIERMPLGDEIERRTGFQKVIRTSGLGGLVTGLAQRNKELRFLGPIVGPTSAVPAVLDLYGKVSQRVPGARTVDDTALLPSMRIVKEPRELALMRKAVDATRAGHLAAMRAVRPGMTERALKEIMEDAFRKAGGTGLAYESIVAAGRNAASLHYRGGNGVIEPGSLVLIDAAASVGGYACDVTRTFPADGRFTATQRETYETVLAAQDAAVKALRAGAYYEDVDAAARAVIRKAGHADDFYHGVGHLVGTEVHDAGDTSKPLPAGAVITVEPGIYVQAQNYGIRIEDQYLITATGNERMSVGIPRTIAEIEGHMAGGR
ncbi:MAG: aminopeptidase P family protein [Sphingomonas sp.]|uniref:M24 family metallopeptidase n=1 Tax=Sphingomonas sp. TaxID=28214 RepID=UPI0025D524AB|nr:Xaa-Pro peptidase family protein [Sphingomonas sp.]MBX3566073.1 aminopeptidase P family protein [Sphingomonas sp.]